MLLRKSKHALLSLAILGLLGAGVVADATAQMNRDDSSSARRQKPKKEEVKYPEATRESPKPTSKVQSQLSKLFKANEKEGNEAEVLALAKELMATEKAGPYDKSVAAQLAAQASYNTDDSKGAKEYSQQALDFNGLDNNNHYGTMFFLAQLYSQDDQYTEALATIDRFLSETKSQKPEELVVKGNILYRMERYQDAIPLLKQAVETSPEPKNEWMQLLMASYSEAGQTDAAVKLAESLAAKNPSDKKAQMNLASVYVQADQSEKATAVLEKLRSTGQLTDEREYKQLYSMYANMDGKEKDVISVINEGLQKGALKQDDYQVNLALAQSYYYSEQIPQAIDAWRKAAPLSKDGETYLNLAKVLWQEGRVPEAKEAAKAGLAKGLKKPEEAKKILTLP
jgi:tetratricopeptide (TPR) repeat protein